MSRDLSLYYGQALGQYGFGPGHPFNLRRQEIFWEAFRLRSWSAQFEIREPVTAGQEVLERFHTADYVEQVKRASATGGGFLDWGDTPAYAGVYEAAAAVAGSTVDAAERILAGECRKAFIPIAGLHHARRDRAAGFCVFNDCGVAIETLLRLHGLERIGYVDIDAHHGDGVYYGFEADPRVVMADIHEDGRSLYPGTGHAAEQGSGQALGTKLNLPLPPGAGDRSFFAAWEKVLAFLRERRPEFILLQCGADGLEGDPLTHLKYSPQVHARATADLCRLAEELGHGRVLAMGGGGYLPENLAAAWVETADALRQAGKKSRP
ncbi:MAG: acetoin utilization protein AcuC [candidate division FCPU426 bacterium]